MKEQIDLIEISEDSWHYKLMKWYLGSNAPTPEDTFNLCRYFWIFMFCIVILVPLYTPINIIVKVIRSIDKYFFKKLMGSFDKWIINGDPYDFYNIEEYGFGYVPKKYRKIKGGSYDIIYEWGMRNFNLDYYDFYERIIIREKLRDLSKKVVKPVDSKLVERMAKRKELLDKINNKLNFINRGWDKLVDSIRPFGKLNFSKLIKITKRVLGVLITGLMLVGTYFIVNLLTCGFIYAFNFIVDNQGSFIEASKLLFMLISGSIIIFLIVSFIKHVINEKYHYESIWYLKILYSFILGFVSFTMFIYDYLIYWVVVLPLNTVFNYILWKFICLRLIKPIITLVWSSIMGFTEIFRVYFSASKDDYCPGIKWTKK